MKRRHALILTAALATTVAATLGVMQAAGAPRTSTAEPHTPASQSRGDSQTHHYLYVFPDQAMYVYDIDRGHRLVTRRALPGVTSTRGAVASPRTHMLYISHGGDGGENGNGSLLAYDLLRNRIVWDRSYSFGIDSPAINNPGTRIYLPDGALSSDGHWNIIDAASGRVVGRIVAGAGPHDTVVGPSGRRVYLGGRDHNYLEVASTSTNHVTARLGPLYSGVRPFTVNGHETLAYISSTGLLGFQVGSLGTGRVLYTVRPPSRFSWDPGSSPFTDPSHGISLSPDERELWISDGPNNYLHVFAVSGLPARAPSDIKDIPLRHQMTGEETGCSYACTREGWLLHSSSGCFVYVGDSGDVFSATTFRPVKFLAPLRQTKIYLEIDWRRGRPAASTSRFGIGRATGAPPAPPRCSS